MAHSRHKLSGKARKSGRAATPTLPEMTWRPPRISIKSLLASNANVDLDDAMKTKTAVRRLGYYKTPSYGMTPYPDAQLFDAVSDLQRDKGLRRTGEVRPGDDTEKAIRTALSESANNRGKYIWRTRGDSKVRSEHAERDGKVFSWDDPPEGGHPGEAPNCRCRAEAVTDKKAMCESLFRAVENARLKARDKQASYKRTQAEQIEWERIYVQRQQEFIDTLLSFGVSAVPKSRSSLKNILSRILAAARVKEAMAEIIDAWDAMDEADQEPTALKSGKEILFAEWQSAQEEYGRQRRLYDQKCPLNVN